LSVWRVARRGTRSAKACQGVANEMVYNTYANIRFQLGGADGSVKVRPSARGGAQRGPHTRARAAGRL
jgi:hypothetical protein